VIFLRKAVTNIIAAISLISAIAVISATYIFYKQSQLSPAEFSNQVAENLGLIEENEELIFARKKYQNRFKHLAVEQAYPRLLNKEYTVNPSPHQYFRDHVTLLNTYNENVSISCDKQQLEALLSCFLYNGDSDQATFEALRAGLNNFVLDEPKESSYYGNGWIFAYVYDLSRAVGSFDNNDIKQIDARIAQVLEIYLSKLDRQNASLWHGRASIASSAFLLATVLDTSVEYNRGLYSRSYGHFIDLMNAVEASGTWPEGYDYWIKNRGHLIALGLSTVMNHPNSPDRQRAFNLLTELGLTHIYLTRPDNVVEGYGDEGSRIDLKFETRKVIDIIAKATNHEVILKFSVWLQKLHPDDSYHHNYTWMKPYFISPQIYTDFHQNMNEPSEHLIEFEDILPTGKMFGKNSSNHTFIRSDWSKDATYITFRASNIYTHHQHYDAGHFTIFKHHPLLTTSGTYSTLGSEHRLNYAIRTVSKNSLLIMQTEENNRLLNDAINDGGQKVIMPRGSSIYSFHDWAKNVNEKGEYWASSLIEANLNNKTKIISADFSAAYNDRRYFSNNTKAKKAKRSLIYLEDEDAVIVSDLVVPEDKSYTVKSLFHTYNRPVVDKEEHLMQGTFTNGISQSNSQQFKVSMGDARLFADIVLPLKPRLTLIGGDDYQYYVDVDGDEASLDGKNMLDGAKSDPWFETPLWRAELSNHYKSESYKSLVVLQPRINNTPKHKLLHYMNDESITLFSIGETLVLYGNKPVKLDFLATAKISRILMIGGKEQLKYRVVSVDDCKSYQQKNDGTFFALLNVDKHARMQVQISKANDPENKCWL